MMSSAAVTFSVKTELIIFTAVQRISARLQNVHDSDLVPSTSTTISAQAPYSVIISSRLFIPEQTWSWSHKFPHIKARKCDIGVPAQVWHWKSFLFEEKSGSPLKCPGHSFGVSQQTCLSATEGWRHKSNIRGLREWLPCIYESIRLHFLLKAKNNRQPLHAAVGFSSFLLN